MSIVLTVEDSLNLRREIFHPDDEHIKKRDELFKHIDGAISIRKDGDAVIADFKELDLSDIDYAEVVVPTAKEDV